MTSLFSQEYTDHMKRLNEFYLMVKAVVLDKQNPVSGLLPASTAVTSHGDYRDAWVRDNVYSILCVWALSLAYEKVDYDHGRTYELKHSVVKLMRGLLFSMMRQAHKVETFKHTQRPIDSLHAKYNTATCEAVVGDAEWGHLQLDATSIYLLTLAQMTASGLQIIYTLDEVNFVQNLVYYIERAYRTPDFGAWERGNKLNNGQPELNSSSIGMVTAALEAIDGLDLFGSRGGPDSVIHVIPDEITKNYITLQSFLPRESDSKEVDAGVLAVIGYPAFAAGSKDVIDKTFHEIKSKLEGPYGFARFLLDGHQNVLEDPHRLHYELHELRIFRDIECEWPLFFTYMIIDHIFSGDMDEARLYREKLENTLVTKALPNGYVAKLVPELYVVPADKIDEVRQNPDARVRFPNDNIPLVWAQSLMIMGDLLLEDMITVGEIDPIGRRFRHLREKKDTLVQIVLLSENNELQTTLSQYGLETETIDQIAPIKVHNSGALSQLYTHLGKNHKLGLSGRPNRSIGTIGTCKIYRINGEMHVFTPFFLESQKYYLTMDNDMIVEMFKDELQFVRNNWHLSGRPTMFVMLTHTMLHSPNRKNLLNLMVSLKSGLCNRVRVRVGRTKELVNTSCINDLDFLNSSVPYQDILGSSYTKVTHPHLKYEGEQALKRPRGGVYRKSERKSFCLQFLESRLREFESKRASDDQLIRKLSSEYPSASPSLHIPTAEEVDSMIRQITVEECVQKLKESNNLFIQMELLEHLTAIKGLTYSIEGLATIKELLDELYQVSAKSQHWSVTRQAAAVLKKDVEALSASVVDLIIRQVQISLGSGEEIYTITAPHSPSSLHDLIYKFYSADSREAVLVQELIYYLASFIRANPHLFEGIIRIDISYLLFILRTELASEERIGHEEAVEKIFHLSPSAIKRLLHRVMDIRDDKELNSMTADFDQLKEMGYPQLDGLPKGEKLLDSMYSASGEDIVSKRRRVEISAFSGGFLDGNFARVEIDGKTVFEMQGNGIGVCVIDKENGEVLETATFDTHSFAEESNHLADFVLSQKTNLVALVAKSEASENLQEGAKAALEAIGSLRIREMGFRSSWAMIASKDETVEDLRSSKKGPVEDVKITLEFWNSSEYEFLRPSQGKWRLRRHLDGGLNRFPLDFCPRVHEILRKARQGLSVCGSLLPRNPTVDNMTPHERNFALRILKWLESAPNPMDKQLHVECLEMIYREIQNHEAHELRLNDVVSISDIVDTAIQLCWETAQPKMAGATQDFQGAARELFYDLPMNGKHGTLSFFKEALFMKQKDAGLQCNLS